MTMGAAVDRNPVVTFDDAIIRCNEIRDDPRIQSFKPIDYEDFLRFYEAQELVASALRNSDVAQASGIDCAGFMTGGSIAGPVKLSLTFKGLRQRLRVAWCALIRGRIFECTIDPGFVIDRMWSAPLASHRAVDAGK